ncbi:MAG TPA: hypothetical protein VF173_20515 [Thermoanaerobaculia bacterium]|nr:hypothetical protein [Thermoanaerobaculia bacterium]
MKRRRTLRVLKFAVIAIVAVGVFGLLVMSLWNWLMPTLFGVRAITFWQAWGVLILSRILLGSFHGRSHDRRWRARLINRWEQMSPEEREKFREGLRHRWGRFEEATPETKA